MVLVNYAQSRATSGCVETHLVELQVSVQVEVPQLGEATWSKR